MYEIAKSVITSQRFDLASMLAKLDALWLQGSLSDDQRTELQALAREKADPDLSMDLLARLEDHETRLRALEAGGTDPAPGPSEDWPAWQVHHAYRSGDRVTFEGKRYTCALPEHTASTTWSPKDYPGYWQAEA